MASKTKRSQSWRRTLADELTTAAVGKTLVRLANEATGWDGDLPEGDLSEHLDSVDRLALVVAVEDHYEIILEPEDEEALLTVADVVSCIQRKKGA